MDALTVVGAGGIGCAVGHALGAAGVPVVFVEADPAKVAWGDAHGVRVDDRPAVAARFVSFESWRPEPGATVLLCTKCYDNAAVLRRLPDGVAVVPIQNGFDPLLDARGHAVEGIASFISECLPGRTHTRITRGGSLHLGGRGAGASPLAWELAHRLRRAPFRVRVVPDVRPYKHTKLMYNAAIGPLAAAAGLDNGGLLADRRARRLFFGQLRENYAILRGAGVPLGKVGPFHPDTVSRILHRRRLADALAWAFYPSLRRTYCSMAGDLPAGRTEIDYYNGHLIELAGDRPCPLNRRLYDLVKQLEAGDGRPGPQVLDELTADRAVLAAAGA